ncbi:MAG: hypothetical protein NDI61_12350 [Bdellovibrionaceae bacterium]|nr:hypothetical protein [Pseudobdellovibrionaceae bacterium]
MKNLILSFSAVMMVGQVASADIIKCVFTEPFVNTTYSMARQTLEISSFDEDAPLRVIKNVSFQIVGSNQFELRSVEGTVLQKLMLNFSGSDGMSDARYPYDAIDQSIQVLENGKAGAPLYGGCTSNFLSVRNADK